MLSKIALPLYALCVCNNVLAWKRSPLSRRDFVKAVTFGVLPSALIASSIALPARADDPNSFNVDDFLKSGMVAQPMGVSGQAGKSRPETGVVLRDDVSQDRRTGDVLAEIFVTDSSDRKMPVVANFVSPWPLASGTVFDVECRDAKTGDGVFLQVSPPLEKSTSSIDDVKDSFLLDTLLSKTGRFSFYGQPTDVKVRKAETTKRGSSSYRVIDLSFATISQATQTELPRRGRLAATIPTGSKQVVMLIASSTAARWKNKGADEVIAKTLDSFRAAPALA